MRKSVVAFFASLLLASLGLAEPASAQFVEQATWAGQGGGSANAQTVPLPNVQSLDALIGVPFRFVPIAKNTGPATLAVGGTAAKPILTPSTTGLTPLAGGELAGPTVVFYDGTEYVLALSYVAIPPGGGGGGASVPFPGFAIGSLLPSGMTGSATTAAMTIQASGCGSATDSSMTQSILVCSPINWAVANGNIKNGYQGGTSLPASATIYLYVIWGGTGNAAASFASTSLSPTLPGTYVYYRRVAAFNTDGSGNVLGYTATEGEGGTLIAYLNSPTLDANGAAVVSTSCTYVSMNIPNAIPVEWIGNTSLAGPAAANYIKVVGQFEPCISPNLTTAPIADIFISNQGAPTAEVNRHPLVTTNKQIGFRSSASNGTIIYLSTSGWKDYRRS